MGLSACASTKFDVDEYKLITDIRFTALVSKSQCSDSIKSQINSENMVTKTMYLKFYEQYLPNNAKGYDAAFILDKMAHEMNQRYATPASVTPAYCVEKYNIILDSAEMMQYAIGKRQQ